MAEAATSLDGLYLQDSWLKGLLMEGSSLKLRVDLHLTQNHPDHRPAKEGEWACYRSGWLEFRNCRELTLEQTGKTLPRALDGYDFGTFDHIAIRCDHFEIETEIFKLNFQADGVAVSLDEERK